MGVEYYGALQVPLADQDPGLAAPDPLLDVTLAYCKAIANAKCAALWKRLTGGQLPVDGTFSCDPNKRGLQENKLPALFAWRRPGAKTTKIADDYLQTMGEISLVYVMPSVDWTKQVDRTGFAAALQKTLAIYLERERDPAWVVDGDEDEVAQVLGSSVVTWAGTDYLHLHTMEEVPIKVRQLAPHDKARTNKNAYVGYEMRVGYRENFHQGEDVDRFAASMGLDLSMNSGTPTTNGAQPLGWQAGAFHLLNDLLVVASAPFGPAYFQATAIAAAVSDGGFSDVVEPTWPPNVGQTVTDGPITWTRIAPSVRTTVQVSVTP